MITERRQYPRKTPLEFTFIQLEQEFAGHVLNYSKEGLSFETSAPICDSDLVQFWLSFREHGQIDGVGRITWLNEERNRGGIAFVHLSRSSRQKVDEWTAVFPEGTVASVEHKPDEEESPEEIVSKIMEQVLTEKRHSLAMVSPSGKPADGGNAGGATASQAQEAKHTETSNLLTVALAPTSDTTERADMTELRTAEPPETCAGAALPVAATGEESVGLLHTGVAPAIEPHEPRDAEPTENAEAFAPAVAETGELWNAPGTMAAETWDVECAPTSNAPTQSRLEETATPSAASSVTLEPDAAATHCESTSPAPAARKWPTSAPFASTTPPEQNQEWRRQDSSKEETRELVPLKQYLYARRSQFLRGAAIGILLSLAIGVAAFKFGRLTRQGALAEDTREAATANSTIASGATIPEPASAASPAQESKDLGSSPKGQNAISPRKSPVGRADLPVPGQPAEMASGDGAAPASAQEPSNAPTNAAPRPNSFAYRDSAAGSGVQPLIDVTQPGNSDGPTAEAESSSGPPKVGVDLGSTPWSFHRRNIHGTPPVGGEVRPAELISSVAPQYPPAAKARQVSGEVVIDAIIDARGSVRKPRVVSGPTALRSAAVKAVLEWKYKPALLDGKPTEVRETITVKFLP